MNDALTNLIQKMFNQKVANNQQLPTA